SHRGTNHAGWASFEEPHMLAASDLPESYAVVFGQSMTVTKHMIEFGYQGAIRAEGSPDYADWSRDMVR
ncbi:MAG: phosphodiesterase, partial [Pseudomonadota bacterium]